MQKFKTLAANTPKPPVNFDGWASLAQTDPEAFEAKRAKP